ncbi:MAG: NUDIX domain-containing protein [Nitrospira sp.]|nr:NUDIX domain-containing protein [bacterium]MBL7049225.1 NUDIX domain-containing protein [Nitrospira sp.]
MSEKVLVIPASLLKNGHTVRDGGLTNDGTDAIIKEMLQGCSFMPREEAEHDFECKQIIPYVTVKRGEEFLLLQRTSRQSEKRLHNKYSLGIGGHINPIDQDGGEDIIMQSLMRELQEEVWLATPGDLRFIGVINDESNSVSRVHLGLAYVLEVHTPEFKVLEDDKMTARWVSMEELTGYYDSFETWTQIVYDDYIMPVMRNGAVR